MNRYLSTTPRVHLALVATDGRSIYPYPLLEVTPLLIEMWSLWCLGVALLALGGATLDWVGAYSKVGGALLVVLLVALLWGVTPRWVRQGWGRGSPLRVGREG